MTNTTKSDRSARRPHRGPARKRWSFALRAGVGAAVLAVALPTVQASAEPPTALPFSGEGDDIRWQPAMDYDEDGCYPTPAIDADGNLAEGLKLGGDVNGNCRDESDLSNTNMYARSKTNNGWTAYMYTLYFEKDQMYDGESPSSTVETGWNIGKTTESWGHTHDWEHIVVWVDNAEDEVKYVSTSAHDEYETKPASQVEWDGDHPKVVYHKDGGFTHGMRHASSDEELANHEGEWQYPTLVSWNKFPEGIRDTLVDGDFGGTDMGIKDLAHDGAVQFNDELSKAKPEGIPFEPHACPCP